MDMVRKYGIAMEVLGVRRMDVCECMDIQQFNLMHGCVREGVCSKELLTDNQGYSARHGKARGMCNKLELREAKGAEANE